MCQWFKALKYYCWREVDCFWIYFERCHSDWQGTIFKELRIYWYKTIFIVNFWFLYQQFIVWVLRLFFSFCLRVRFYKQFIGRLFRVVLTEFFAFKYSSFFIFSTYQFLLSICCYKRRYHRKLILPCPMSIRDFLLLLAILLTRLLWTTFSICLVFISLLHTHQ